MQLADELHLPNAGIVTVGTRKAKMPFIFKKIQKRLPEHQELEDEEEIQRYMALKAMFILRDAIKEFLVERYVGIGHEPRLTDQERQLGLLRGGSQNNSFFSDTFTFVTIDPIVFAYHHKKNLRQTWHPSPVTTSCYHVHLKKIEAMLFSYMRLKISALKYVVLLNGNSQGMSSGYIVDSSASWAASRS